MYTGIGKPAYEQAVSVLIGALGIGICVAVFVGEIMV